MAAPDDKWLPYTFGYIEKDYRDPFMKAAIDAFAEIPWTNELDKGMILDVVGEILEEDLEQRRRLTKEEAFKKLGELVSSEIYDNMLKNKMKRYL